MNNMIEALERIAAYPSNRSEEMSIETAREIARAAIASQAQQTELVAWGYAWECKSVGDWRIEKLGEGCIPPKDTIALYTAPEGDKE